MYNEFPESDIPWYQVEKRTRKAKKDDRSLGIFSRDFRVIELESKAFQLQEKGRFRTDKKNEKKHNFSLK